MLFEPQDQPRVFGLPIGCDFASELIKGLEERLIGQPAEAMARITLIVNTSRTRKRLTQLFVNGEARFLPRILTFEDVADHPYLCVDLPESEPSLRIKLRLAQLVRKLIETTPDLAPELSAFDLAQTLAELLDEMQGENIPLEALSQIEIEFDSQFWERSLRFLSLLGDCVGPENSGHSQLRLRMVAEAFGKTHAHSQNPVLIAGSTGSRPASAAFMKIVSRLPQGAVILPGVDTYLDEPTWETLAKPALEGGDHPQSGFAKLGKTIGFRPEQIPLWRESTPANKARNKLVSIALRPAPVTNIWFHQTDALKPELDRALNAVTLIEAPSRKLEALAIACRIRAAIEAQKTVALVTPDRALGRLVTAALERWEVIPDESSGTPLSMTPVGIFLDMVARLGGYPLTPIEFLAILKHPLCHSEGDTRNLHLLTTRDLERELLRGKAPFIDFETLKIWAKSYKGYQGRAEHWVEWLEQCFSGVLDSLPHDLGTYVAHHRKIAEHLAKGPDGSASGALWLGRDGGLAHSLMESLAEEASHGGLMRGFEYRALFMSELSGQEVQPDPARARPDIFIWGTLEARVQHTDLVILASLNEGTWPKIPDQDPWLNRKMRAAIGLSKAERRIGLAAHDFQQAMGAAEIVLTRALRDEQAPTMPSRWLARLSNLVGGIAPAALDTLKMRGQDWIALAETLDRPEHSIAPAPRPAPAPTLHARPNRLSVTQIETLIRDPYAIYARHILRLKELAPPGLEPNEMVRGIALHDVMEQFTKETADQNPPFSVEAFIALAEKTLETTVPWPSERRLWLARFKKIAPALLQDENERRAFSTPSPELLECKGEITLDGLDAPFTLSAKADRIDHTENGVALYDYKSGGVPSEKEINEFAKQLLLESAIAEAGGFDALKGPKPVERLEYIGLDAKNSTRVIDLDKTDCATQWEEFKSLIRAWQNPSLGYGARLRPQLLKYESPYDHLSRYGEWDDGDDPITIELSHE